MTTTRTNPSVTPQGAKYKQAKTKGLKTIQKKTKKKRKPVVEPNEDEPPVKPTYMLEVKDGENLQWVTQTSAHISFRAPLRETPKRKCKVSKVVVIKKEYVMDRYLSIKRCVTKTNTFGNNHEPLRVNVCGNKFKMVIKPQPNHIKGKISLFVI